MPSNFRPDFPGYDYDRLLTTLNNTNLSKDDNALFQLITGLIDAAKKQEIRFVNQIQEITKAITVDGYGNIQANNLTGVNTGNVRFAEPSAGFVGFADGSSGQTIIVNPIDLTSTDDVSEDGRGLYTPTLTNVTNLAASTSYQATFCRIGNICYVFGAVDVDPTIAGATELGISLPIASNLAGETDCVGVGASHEVAGFSVGISADTTNNRASMRWVAVDVANRRVWYQFGYRVL